MTLMTYGNSEGTRRCDAKCYDATGPDCDCICGGANHGKGLRAAKGWTAAHARELCKQAGYEIQEHQGELLLEPIGAGGSA